MQITTLCVVLCVALCALPRYLLSLHVSLCKKGYVGHTVWLHLKSSVLTDLGCRKLPDLYLLCLQRPPAFEAVFSFAACVDLRCWEIALI